MKIFIDYFVGSGVWLATSYRWVLIKSWKSSKKMVKRLNNSSKERSNCFCLSNFGGWISHRWCCCRLNKIRNLKLSGFLLNRILFLDSIFFTKWYFVLYWYHSQNLVDLVYVNKLSIFINWISQFSEKDVSNIQGFCLLYYLHYFSCANLNWNLYV